MSRAEPDRPHVLGIDDGPFVKRQPDARTSLVGVTMEGAALVEAVAVTEFPVDGDDVTSFLAEWIDGLRVKPVLHAVLFGGITIAGLSVLDPETLAARLGVPVIVVNRREPTNAAVEEALRAAGHPSRIELLRRTPPSMPQPGGLYAAAAGIDETAVGALLERSRGKSDLPEAIRLAHLIARAIGTGESRGRP